MDYSTSRGGKAITCRGSKTFCFCFVRPLLLQIFCCQQLGELEGKCQRESTIEMSQSTEGVYRSNNQLDDIDVFLFGLQLRTIFIIY